MQFALLGAGHLIGLSVGLAQLFGLILAWAIAVPILTSPETIAWLTAKGIPSIATTLEPGVAAEELASTVWRREVRLMGAGVIGVAAIWTLIKLAGPLISGLSSALAANRRRQDGAVLDRTEQDIPINIVAGLSVACLIGIGFYLPAAVTTLLVIGAVCGWIYDRAIKTTRFADVGRRMGVLLASGLIVGESLFLVMTAGVIVSTGDDAPFAMLPEGSTWPAMMSGIAVFAVLAFALYAWVRGRSAKV